MAAEPVQVRGACPHDCPDRCAWVVTVQDGTAVSLVGDPDHPETRGRLCAKVDHFLDRVYSAERVLHPLKRSGPKGSGAFERIGWDQALDEIAARLGEVVAESGGAAVLPYSFAGTQGVLQTDSVGSRFFQRIGASALDRTICATASTVGVRATLGTSAGLLPKDLVHSRFIVLWGTNPVVTNLHLWPLIREARDNGATVVVVDPVRTRTAVAADWHVRPRPGTDAALALGMMQVIVADGLHDADYLERHAVGFDRLVDRLADYPPDRVAAITGLEESEVVELARAYATTRPAAIRVLVGMEHHRHAEMTLRAVSCLPAVVGAWRDHGGGLAHHPSELFWEALNPLFPDVADPPRTINMVQLGRALTDPELEPPVRALVVYSSNPAATTPHQELVLEGLRREDLFTVVHEQFLTDTALHADVVLPATTQLEHWDLMVSWGHTLLSLNQPAIEPLGESLPHTELFRRLAARMGVDVGDPGETDVDLVRRALDSDHDHLTGIDFDGLLESGWAPLALPDPWMPLAEGGYRTPSGRCELYSEALDERGIDPLPAQLDVEDESDPDGAYPLVLLTAKSALHFLNSSYANMARHLKAERQPLLDIHPDDAEARSICDGDLVEVSSARGSVTLNARVGDRVRAGVVSAPSGWWPSLSPGGRSVNALTPDDLTSWSGGAALHDTRVEVRPASGPR
jgi:anaerobic selenocysteine-containing dehydrogenase